VGSRADPNDRYAIEDVVTEVSTAIKKHPEIVRAWANRTLAVDLRRIGRSRKMPPSPTPGKLPNS
jgi:hypothetical protein